jgi:hypothetical protein
VDTDLAKFEASHPDLPLAQKVKSSVEGLGEVKSLDDLAAFRARKGAEIDPLQRQFDANKDQKKLLEARKGDLEQLVTQRKEQLAALEKEHAEAKKAVPEVAKPQEPAPTPEATEARKAQEAKALALEKQKAQASKDVQDLEQQRGELESRLKTLTENQEKLSQQMRPLYVAITKVSEQLAEVTAIMYVKQRYPNAELKFGGPGSVTQSGVFDQIWFVKDGRGPGKDLWLVVEAKGGVSDLGSRQVGTMIAEQGSPAYFNDVVSAMARGSNSTAKQAAGDLLTASPDEVAYLLIQAPYRTENGTLKPGEPKVKRFDLSPRTTP